MARPIVGVTMDIATLEGRRRLTSSPAYVDAIHAAGGAAVLLAPIVDAIAEQVERCDAIVLTGGDDPRMEPYGEPTHPKATPVDEQRQSYEERLLAHLAESAPDLPLLGVCLGMQMMGLAAGAGLDQHMPESCDPTGRHWDGTHHVQISGVLGESGPVFSRHKQCLSDAGSLEVMAVADDGVIEGVVDRDRPFHVGVQWHPERTDGGLGAGVFGVLLDAVRRSAVV